MFFQAVRGFSAQRSGTELLFLTLTQILTVVVVGALVSKIGYYVSLTNDCFTLTLTLVDTLHHRRYSIKRGMSNPINVCPIS
jgi:hypothetical protein